MTTYNQAVQNNLIHMGTSASQWSAVPISGMAGSDAPGGRRMPEFSFPDPAIYGKAPTLYPCNPAPAAMNCELCGHSPIKTAYWLQNDVKRWTLLVGSECVTYFAEGKSGQRLAKEHIWAANRETVRGYQDLVARFRARWMYDAQEGYWGTYGYNYRKVRRWHIGRPPSSAIIACEQLDNLTGNIVTDAVDTGFIQREATTDGAITRWMKTNADRAAEMAAILEANL
jgi:hypothetical protein